MVDDEPAVLAIMRELLSTRYDVRFATGGGRAIALASAAPPDLILLDVEMPEMDGYAVCRQLREVRGCEETPVMFLTSRATVEDEERGFASGAVDYVLKPISPAVLLARVQTQLALRRAVQLARAEQMKADRMLNLVLPRSAADELRATGTVLPRHVDNAVVMFADVVNFTAWCGTHQPSEVVQTLHSLFSDVEEILHRHGLEKLKTIGDGVMAAAGLLEPHPDALDAAVACGLEMTASIRRHEPAWQFRIGVHSGPVVTGIVGTERFQFDVWGDTVNLAARLCSAGSPGTVCLLQTDVGQLRGSYAVRDLGKRALKGKGELHIVEVHRPAAADDGPTNEP